MLGTSQSLYWKTFFFFFFFFFLAAPNIGPAAAAPAAPAPTALYCSGYDFPHRRKYPNYLKITVTYYTLLQHIARSDPGHFRTVLS